MTKTETLRWGLLGTARINRSVIPPLRASRRNRLDAVASRTPERAEAYAREWGIDRVFGSYDAMLADPAIDVVYIAVPNGLHAMWTVRAVEAGKHVLCEKPLAISVEEVDGVIAAAARHGRIVAEGFMYRHHPQTALVQRLIGDGTLGDLRLVRGSFTFQHTRMDDVRWDPALGGGSLWDVGCYPVSFARLVSGVEAAEVQGTQVLGPTGVDLSFAGVLRFPGDVLAVVDSSFVAPFHTSVDIVGSVATLRVASPFKPGPEASIVIVGEDGSSREVPAEGQELYSGEVEDLARAVLDGAPPRMSLADSRGNVAALVALYEAARTGMSVPLRI
jgi:xylose dehydrogenase (NAD/NADP)